MLNFANILSLRGRRFSARSNLLIDYEIVLSLCSSQ